MEKLSDNHYMGTGADLTPIAKACTDLYGVTGIFGLGGSGKTVLAESFLSVYQQHVLDTNHSTTAHDAVVSAVLRSWLNPAFFQAAMDEGVLPSEKAEAWAKGFIESLELSNLASIYALCATTESAVANSLDYRLKLAGRAGEKGIESVAPTGATLAPVYGFTHEDKEYVAANLLGTATERTQMCVALPLIGKDKAPALILRNVPTDAKRVDPDDFVELIGAYLDRSDIAIKDDGSENWFCAPLGNNNFKIEHSVHAHPLFHKNPNHELCLTQHGVQVRTPDEVAKHKGHTHVQKLDWMLPLVEARLAQDDVEIDEISVSDESEIDAFKSLLDESSVMLLAILAESGVVDLAVTRSSTFSAIAHQELAKLVDSLNLVAKPTLIMTEMKARKGYGAVAYNKNIEAKGVELELKFGSKDDRDSVASTIKYTADCSLVNATVGSLILGPVTHVSVLDLTLAFDIVFNSSTQKGGLDSSMLHMLQYLSNIATMANGYLVVETRDDFVTSNNEEEATERARTTLGANSRIAAQIQGTGADARSIWIRIKGGDEVEDCWIDMLAVTPKDYPVNLIREKGTRPSLPDLISSKA